MTDEVLAAMKAGAAALGAKLRKQRQDVIPAPEELAAYAAQLPAIYRQVLAAFQDAQPGRWAGEDVAAVTIQKHILNTGTRYDADAVIDACRELEAGGFLEETTRTYESFAPTPVGEALIGAVTGHPTPARSIPPLPKPTW